MTTTSSTSPTPLTDHPPTYTIRGPEDLLALAPIMLGFAPADSVVLESLGGRPFHARLDLPQRRDLDRATAEGIADALLDPARRLRVTSVALLFYSDDPDAVDRAWRPLRRRCARLGLTILEALRVEDGRYFPLRGDRRLRERGVPFDVSAHPFTARAVASGQVTHRSREELVATLGPDSEARAETARHLVQDGHRDAGVPASAAALRDAAAWVRGVVSDHVADDTTTCATDVARLAWLLQVAATRNAAWSLVERSTADRHARFWSDVIRRVPDALAATPAALLAWAAWQSGNGALAWAAVDRCREIDPEDPLARTVAHALEHAVPPEAADDAEDAAS